ncbi:MAG: CooT family nickel-binding protein [Candidatus Jordarchaeales archaeon]
MCEFKVRVEEGYSEKEVAEDVVYIKMEDGGLVLKDVTGMLTKVDSALVSYVNVMTEELRLIKHPLIGAFLKLLSEVTSSKNPEEAQRIWETFVEEGRKLLGVVKK